MKKRMTFFRNSLLCALVSLLAVPFVFAQDDADLPADSLAEIRRRGEIVVGVSVFEPWVMRDADGELIGYEIEVARKLAEDLGVELKLQPVGFEGIIGDLNNGRFDVVVTGMYATPERALLVNFTEPLNYSTVELVANRSRADGDKIGDYNKAEVTIGFVAGTVYGDIAAQNFPMAKVQTFGNELELFNALSEGKVTAAIASTPVPEIKARLSGGKLKVALKEPLAKYGESLAVRPGDTEFLNYLNTWVRYYRNSPWLSSEYKKWFVDMDWLEESR